MKVLLTGAAGFIGSTLSEKLAKRGDQVLGIDNLNDYYSVEQKERNLAGLAKYDNFQFQKIDFCEKDSLQKAFKEFQPDVVAHLGGMANVRHSIDNPAIFSEVNVCGTNNLLELACLYEVDNFVMASTGSIYGKREDFPFREEDQCDLPLAAYPASKKAAELIAHAFHNLHGLNFTSLRFFNVYGPKGRPDMMPYRMVEAILNDEEIPIFGQGLLERDWTYVDDLVNGFIAALDCSLGYEIINLGRGQPILLNDFIKTIEEVVGKPVRKKFVETPASEPQKTYADITKAKKILGYNPQVSFPEGFTNFWHYYQETFLK